MKKYVVTLLLSLISFICFAAEAIPDPTVQITTPPAGLPGMSSNIGTYIAPPLDPLRVDGVILAEKDTPSTFNKVLMNGNAYKVNSIINDRWKVKSINSKKIVLINLETKAIKTINILGE